MTTNFKFSGIKRGILVCRSLDPSELRLVCSNRIVNVKRQLDYQARSSRTREHGIQVLTFQDFMPFVPIYLSVKGKDWARILLHSGYDMSIIRIAKPTYMAGLLENASREIYRTSITGMNGDVKCKIRTVTPIVLFPYLTCVCTAALRGPSEMTRTPENAKGVGVSRWWTSTSLNKKMSKESIKVLRTAGRTPRIPIIGSILENYQSSGAAFHD